MSSPRVFLEEQLELRDRLKSGIEMMENHLAGRLPQVGSWENAEDVTEERLTDLKEQLIDVEARIERLNRGNL